MDAKACRFLPNKKCRFWTLQQECRPYPPRKRAIAMHISRLTDDSHGSERHNNVQFEIDVQRAKQTAIESLLRWSLLLVMIRGFYAISKAKRGKLTKWREYLTLALTLNLLPD
jgi:hypothetical protein